MRQAGRYLPEYRAIRENAGSFWAMCLSPEFAAEVTLQPIRRFDFDAAVIFSDIFVVPAGLGIDVSFEEGVGPRMVPIVTASKLVTDAERWTRFTSPVYEAIRSVRGKLQAEKSLVGFAGAPWTLATYLAQGGRSDDQRAAKVWGYTDPVGFDALLERLADAVAIHLIGQIRAGADVIQIFDSWASGLPAHAFARWVIGPTQRVVAAVRKEAPDARIIGFPRAATLEGYKLYARQTGVDGISVDTSAPMQWAAESLGRNFVVQGNLDPLVLLAGGQALANAIDEILNAMKEVPFIFNLGHGILPETPLAHVEKLVARIRAPH